MYGLDVQGGDLGGKLKKMQGKTRDMTHRSAAAAQEAACRASTAAEKGTSVASEKGKVRRCKTTGGLAVVAAEVAVMT